MIHLLINVVRGFLSGDGALILPEMELALFACGILLIDRWLAVNEKHWNALLALAGTVFSGFTLFVQHRRMQALRDLNPESPGLLGLHQSVLVDPLFLFFAALFLAATALVILFSDFYLKVGKETRGANYAVLLVACVGMMLMVSGVDLIVVFLGLELMGFSCFLLQGFSGPEQGAGIGRRNYALLWGCSSASLMTGFAVLYGVFRSTNLGRIGAALEVRVSNGVPFGGLTARPTVLALVFLAAGVLFLIEAVPFHWFAPGIYEFMPTLVAAYLGAAAKVAAFGLLLRFFSFLFLFAHEKWIHVWGGVAIVSLLWGNLAAIRQNHVKRLLAYGSIAQTGFIMLGLVAANEAGFSGMIYYVGIYVFMTLGAFGILMVLEQRGEVSGPEAADLNGLYRRSPVAALLLLVFLLSLAGVPPTAGFMAKYDLVRALILAHPELAAFAVVNALVGVYYYGRLAARMWRNPAPDAVPLDAPAISSGQTVALTAAVFVSLVAGLYPEPFLRMARYAFGQ